MAAGATWQLCHTLNLCQSLKLVLNLSVFTKIISLFEPHHIHGKARVARAGIGFWNPPNPGFRPGAKGATCERESRLWWTNRPGVNLENVIWATTPGVCESEKGWYRAGYKKYIKYIKVGIELAVKN